MDITSPTYQPEQGVSIDLSRLTTGIDGVPDDDAAVLATLISIADMQAELRALRDALTHPNAGEEARIAASYVLTDLADKAMSLRFALEMTVGR